jgi:hypothetical protein
MTVAESSLRARELGRRLVNIQRLASLLVMSMVGIADRRTPVGC